MRKSFLVIVALLFAACVEPESPEQFQSSPRQVPPAAEPAADAMASPRDLAVGTAWRYQASGVNDLDKTITVVVADKTADGYLFAAASKDQLFGEIAWGRNMLGLRDGQLNRVESPGRAAFRLFDFPLDDGKTWKPGKADLEVVVQRTSIETPSGPLPGVRIGGSNGPSTVSWEYVPEIGFLVRYVAVSNGLELFRIELIDKTVAEAYVWYEQVSQTIAIFEGSDSDPVKRVTVKPEAHSVILLGAGSTDVRGMVTQPGSTQPWTFSGRGCCTEPNAWTIARVNAAPGDWTLAVGGSTGFGYLYAVTVKWVEARPQDSAHF